MGSSPAHTQGSSHKGQCSPHSRMPKGEQLDLQAAGGWSDSCQDHTQGLLCGSCVPGSERAVSPQPARMSWVWTSSAWVQPAALCPAAGARNPAGTVQPGAGLVPAVQMRPPNDGCIKVFPAPTDYKGCLAEQESVCLLRSAQTVASVNTSHMSN